MSAIHALELLYRGVNRVRRGLYRRGILRPKKLQTTVISIGNIAAGGAGKTPCVIAVARDLCARGFRVAVLTRGYGRAGEGGVVESLDAERYGDEPVLIKKSIPNINVIVGKNRFINSCLVTADVYLLDDGFQHLQLARDLDIVIDSPAAPFHREGRSALRDADIVLQRRVRPGSLEPLRGRRVFAFAGLADNAQFFTMLSSRGVDLAGTKGFPDHHRYSPADVGAIRAAAAASGADAIATTEKDAVKLGGEDFVAIGIEFDIDFATLERIAAVVGR